MLQNLADQVRDCMQRATDYARQANEVIDPRQRAEWLSLRGRYLALASGIAKKALVFAVRHVRLTRANIAPTMEMGFHQGPLKAAVPRAKTRM
jgi:hypothetical protein